MQKQNEKKLIKTQWFKLNRTHFLFKKKKNLVYCNRIKFLLFSTIVQDKMHCRYIKIRPFFYSYLS